MNLKVIVPLVGIILLGGLALFLADRKEQYEQAKQQEGVTEEVDLTQAPATTPVATEQPPKPKGIDAGLYYDWNIGSGPLSEKLRPMVTERLIEVHSSGRVIYRLAKAFAFGADESRIEVKDAIYWSDKTRLVPEHVAAAFERAKKAASAGLWAPEDADIYNWLKNLSVSTAEGKFVVVKGVQDEEDLQQLAASRLLSPIRPDLVAEGKDPRKAWTISIGAYALKDVIFDEIPRGTIVELQPNPYFYRGRRRNDATIAVDPLYPKS